MHFVMKMSSNKNSSSMPIWITNCQIDPKWIVEKMTKHFPNVLKCNAKDISNDTRKGDVVRNGTTLLLTLTMDDEISTSRDVVVKQVPPSGLNLSKELGLAREAIFFNRLAPRIDIRTGAGAGEGQVSMCVPKTYYSYGDMSTGTKVVFMENLSNEYIDSGILFGPGNPNNWNRDLKAKIDEAYTSKFRTPPTGFEVANETFLAIATVHATFWKDESLLNYDWLRGSSWAIGSGKDTWIKAQSMIQKIWENALVAGDIDTRINWNPLVKEILSRAMEGISWDEQVKRLNKNSHYCLVHGDFWPGNVMISKTDVKDLKILDWEMVGIGSGPQELGQYVVSNMDPSERKACEEKLLKNYYNKLTTELGVSSVDFTWEDCWKEYTIGGLERWLWVLAYFLGQNGVLLKWAQFFHDQISAFVNDHSIKPCMVTQPRP